MEQKSTTSKLETLTPRRGFMKKLIATAAGITILSDIMKGADDKNKNKTNNIYPSPAGTAPYLGEIALFAFNFAPKGWAQCNGQILSISQNQALFSLLQTNYGGNGVNTFALPDLRGRVAVSFGQGAGLSNYTIGQMSGTENVTLITSQIPQHTHTLAASSSTGNSPSPSGNYPALNSEGVLQYSTHAPDTSMNVGIIGLAGGNLPHTNLQPYLVLNYCIAMVGDFPPQP